MNVSDGIFHPEPDRLEALAAGELEGSDLAVTESHLLGCARCRTEVEEWRSLFGAIAELPAPAPGPGFADRVMARVEVRRPLAARLVAMAERLMPRTTKGWMLVVALLALPAAGVTAGAAWIATRPWLTLDGVAAFFARQLTAAAASLPQRGLGLLVESPIGALAVDLARRLLAGGAAPIGLAAALFATFTVASAWIIYENLIRTPTRDRTYAS